MPNDPVPTYYETTVKINSTIFFTEEQIKNAIYEFCYVHNIDIPEDTEIISGVEEY